MYADGCIVNIFKELLLYVIELLEKALFYKKFSLESIVKFSIFLHSSH